MCMCTHTCANAAACMPRPRVCAPEISRWVPHPCALKMLTFLASKSFRSMPGPRGKAPGSIARHEEPGKRERDGAQKEEWANGVDRRDEERKVELERMIAEIRIMTQPLHNRWHKPSCVFVSP